MENLNCNILQKARRRMFDFGENAYPHIFVNREKLDFNVILVILRMLTVFLCFENKKYLHETSNLLVISQVANQDYLRLLLRGYFTSCSRFYIHILPVKLNNIQ